MFFSVCPLNHLFPCPTVSVNFYFSLYDLFDRHVKVFFSHFFICIVNKTKKRKKHHHYIVMLLDCSNQSNRPCIEVNKQSQWTPLASVVAHSSCVCPSLPLVLLSTLVARGHLAEKTPRPQGKPSERNNGKTSNNYTERIAPLQLRNIICVLQIRAYMRHFTH